MSPNRTPTPKLCLLVACLLAIGVAAAAGPPPDPGDEIQLAARAQIGKTSHAGFQVAARAEIASGRSEMQLAARAEIASGRSEMQLAARAEIASGRSEMQLAARAEIAPLEQLSIGSISSRPLNPRLLQSCESHANPSIVDS